jgi:hypothetical protein
LRKLGFFEKSLSAFLKAVLGMAEIAKVNSHRANPPSLRCPNIPYPDPNADSGSKLFASEKRF